MKSNARFLVCLLMLSTVQVYAVEKKVKTPPPSQPKAEQPLPPVVIERAWSPVPEATNFDPKPGFGLLGIELTARSPEPTTLRASETLVVDSSGNSSIPVAAAAFFARDFMPFAGFLSGWRTDSGPAGSVAIGREKPEEPISMVLKGKTSVILLYMVPENERSFGLKVGDARLMPLKLSPAK